MQVGNGKNAGVPDIDSDGAGGLAEVPWSVFARKLAPNPIRAISNEVNARIARGEDVLMLVGGRPPTELLCPFKSLSFDGRYGSGSITLDEADWNYGMGMSRGLPALRAWCTDFVKMQCSPAPKGQHETIITVGNTHGIMSTLLLLSDPFDFVLCESFAYSGLHAIAAPHDRLPIGIGADADGMLPSALDERCMQLIAEGRPAHLVYLTCMGQNPTGTTMPETRRRELYQVCRRHDLFILEDDPYLWLQLSDPRAEGEEEASAADMAGISAGRGASFLHLDEDGRVIRLDSISKAVSPAMRLGWLTATSRVALKIALATEVMTWPLSCASQGIFLALVRSWGDAGLDRHLREVQLLYSRRRDLVHQAALRLLSDVAEWSAPTAGIDAAHSARVRVALHPDMLAYNWLKARMFFWIRAKACGARGVDAVDLIDDLLAAGVAILPGCCFASEHGELSASSPCAAFRVSFTLIDTAAKADLAMERIALVLRRNADSGCERGAVGKALASSASGDVEAKRRQVAKLEASLRLLREQIEKAES